MKKGKFMVTMQHHPYGRAWLRRPWLTLTAAAACMLGSSYATAAVTFNPFATFTIEHHSNIFQRSADAPPQQGQLNGPFGDTIMRYLVGATADFNFGRDSLSLNAQGSHYGYEHYDQLNHNESVFGGVFKWHLGPIADGKLEYSQTRMQTPQANTLSQQLEIQTERELRGLVRLYVMPRWRLDLEPAWREYDLPLPAFPLFGYRETGLAGSINYLGIARLTAGLRAEYVDGAYHHIDAATKYQQKVAGLTADYAITNFSSFDLQAGYTWRNSDLVNVADANLVSSGVAGFIGSTKTFTGSLGFTRKLSVKTSVSVKAFREIDSYVAGANSEIGTGVEATARWAPDVKFTTLLSYRYSRQAIQGSILLTNLAAGNFPGRTDRTQDVRLSVEYHAFKWLTLRPYVERQTRSSNLNEANFNDTVTGIDFTARLHQNQPNQQ
jgi:hypothetical protein